MNGAFRFQFESLFFRLDIQKDYLYVSEKFISRKMLVCINSISVTRLYILFVSTLLNAVSQKWQDQRWEKWMLLWNIVLVISVIE